MAIKEEEETQQYSNKRSILIREDLEYSAQKIFTYSAIGLTAIGIYVYPLTENSGSESSPPESNLNQSELDPVAKFQQRQARTEQLNNYGNPTTQIITYTLIATAVVGIFVYHYVKRALKGFYEENLKQTIETKTAYYENLLKENIAFSQNTQKIAIALGTANSSEQQRLLVPRKKLVNQIIKTKRNNMTINYKYIALGILVSYLGLYVYNLTQMPQESKSKRAMRLLTEYNARRFGDKLQQKLKDKENMLNTNLNNSNPTPLFQYPQQNYTCDKCGGEFQKTITYSPAQNKQELDKQPTYCSNCAEPNLLVPVKIQRSKKVKAKRNPVAYYQCMSACCQQGISPKRITQIAHECKHNSVGLLQERTNEIRKLNEAYQQIGICLTNLLQP
ncbi:19217_t:CDS:2, partial [Racocetra fulgida]